MITLSVEEAEERYEEVIKRVLEGEDVILTRNGTPLAKMQRIAASPVPDFHRPSAEEQKAARAEIWRQLLELDGAPQPVEMPSHEEAKDDQIR